MGCSPDRVCGWSYKHHGLQVHPGTIKIKTYVESLITIKICNAIFKCWCLIFQIIFWNSYYQPIQCNESFCFDVASHKAIFQSFFSLLLSNRNVHNLINAIWVGFWGIQKFMWTWAMDEAYLSILKFIQISSYIYIRQILTQRSHFLSVLETVS